MTRETRAIGERLAVGRLRAAFTAGLRGQTTDRPSSETAAGRLRRPDGFVFPLWSGQAGLLGDGVALKIIIAPVSVAVARELAAQLVQAAGAVERNTCADVCTEQERCHEAK